MTKPPKRVITITTPSRPLLPIEKDLGSDVGWLGSLRKEDAGEVVWRDDHLAERAMVKNEDGELVPSEQGVPQVGRVEHPFDFVRARVLREYNVHHSTCLETRRASAVSLGWRNKQIAEVLDPLCPGSTSFADLMEQVGDDLEELGNGYIEVARAGDGRIAGLYYVDAALIYIYLDDQSDANSYFYELDGESVTSNPGGAIRFAQFGGTAPGATNELIHFRNPKRGERYYGVPAWKCGVPAMELQQAIVQHNFDFFLNRCVPELLFLVTGVKVADADWEAIEENFEQHVGLRNQRKTMAVNIPGEEVEAKVEKLGMESGGETDGFAVFSSTNALDVVSAHRVPPLLAGITVPGKMGAANELTNALMAFQVLAIAPRQKGICSTFAQTLGDEKKNGGLGLTRAMFLGEDVDEEPEDPLAVEQGVPPAPPKDHKGNGLRTILDELDLGQMETASKMRQSMVEAKAQGRDLQAGPAERGSDIGAGRGAGTTTGGKK